MTTSERIKAAGCWFNFLWKCEHPNMKGCACNGPCDKYQDLIACPKCGNPIEAGYCINKLCSNHGR